MTPDFALTKKKFWAAKIQLSTLKKVVSLSQSANQEGEKKGRRGGGWWWGIQGGNTKD